jgi:hypothetical protein
MKIYFFWRKKINYKKTIMFTQNNFIIVSDSVKECGGQIWLHIKDCRLVLKHSSKPQRTRVQILLLIPIKRKYLL